MCVAIPARIVAAGEPSGVSRPARVLVGAVERDVDLALVPEATVGDYVVVHSGYAVALVRRADARRTITLLGTDHSAR